jgi:hypothetical protein
MIQFKQAFAFGVFLTLILIQPSTPSLASPLLGFCGPDGQKLAEALVDLENQLNQMGDVCAPSFTPPGNTKIEQVVSNFNSVMDGVFQNLRTDAYNAPISGSQLADTIALRSLLYSLSADAANLSITESNYSSKLSSLNWIVGDGPVPALNFQPVSLCSFKTNIKLLEIALPKRDNVPPAPASACNFNPSETLKTAQAIGDWLVPHAHATVSFPGQLAAGIQAEIAVNAGTVMFLPQVLLKKLPNGAAIQAGVIRKPKNSGGLPLELYMSVSTSYSISSSLISSGPFDIPSASYSGSLLMKMAGEDCNLSSYLGPTFSFSGGSGKFSASAGFMPNIETPSLGANGTTLVSNGAPATLSILLQPFRNTQTKPVSPADFSGLSSSPNISGFKDAATKSIKHLSLDAATDPLASSGSGFTKLVASMNNLSKNYEKCMSVSLGFDKSGTGLGGGVGLSNQSSFFNTGHPNFGGVDILLLTGSMAVGISAAGAADTGAGGAIPPEQLFWIGLGGFLAPQAPSVIQAAWCTYSYNEYILNQKPIPNFCVRGSGINGVNTPLQFNPAAGWVSVGKKVGKYYNQASTALKTKIDGAMSSLKNQIKNFDHWDKWFVTPGTPFL